MPPKTVQKEKSKAQRLASWYKADDEMVPFKRRQRKPRAQGLRKCITPGTVLILLGGRFKGKRVVFLRQLKTGLLLVTGPHKVNGVPLKRVNQAYVIATQTKVDITGVNSDKINDEYFLKTKHQARKNEKGFWAKQGEATEEQKSFEEKRLKEKRETQSGLDKALLANVKKVPFLKQYLSSRFSISKNTRPHEIIF